MSFPRIFQLFHFSEFFLRLDYGSTCALNLREAENCLPITRWHRACRDCQRHCLAVPRHESAAGPWNPRTWRYEPALLDLIYLCEGRQWYWCNAVFLRRILGARQSPLLILRVEGSLVRECIDSGAMLRSPTRRMYSRSSEEWTLDAMVRCFSQLSIIHPLAQCGSSQRADSAWSPRRGSLCWLSIQTMRHGAHQDHHRGPTPSVIQ